MAEGNQIRSTGVTGTAAVEMQYDNLGNRIEMTDGLGTQAYEYDELSRLTAAAITQLSLSCRERNRCQVPDSAILARYSFST
ncbi:MAG: RHS repeat protein [Acidobacteria bacterium]|nr:RHS repeat protein [Acidobacteriota bacterium]